MAEILVLYYSRSGATAELARQVCRGVEGVAGASARLRTVPPVYAENADKAQAGAGERGTLRHTRRSLRDARTGARQPHALRQHGRAAEILSRRHGKPVAVRRARGKPAAVFTSTQTMHGGQETTLLSMMLPLLHHGMYLVGLPYTERALNETTGGGTPYGASHVCGPGAVPALTDHEKSLAQALGKRVASLAVQLASGAAGARGRA